MLKCLAVALLKGNFSSGPPGQSFFAGDTKLIIGLRLYAPSRFPQNALTPAHVNSVATLRLLFCLSEGR
jgi:hypothetical protein